MEFNQEIPKITQAQLYELTDLIYSFLGKNISENQEILDKIEIDLNFRLRDESISCSETNTNMDETYKAELDSSADAIISPKKVLLATIGCVPGVGIGCGVGFKWGF